MMEHMLEAIMADIGRFYHMYSAGAFCMAAITFLLTAAAGAAWGSRNGRTVRKRDIFKHSVIAAALAANLYIVVGITMLSRQEGYSRIINVRPFSTFHADFGSRKFLAENLMLLVPYAVLLYALAGIFRRAWVMFLMGLSLSLTIETAQLLTHLGRFEVDDILTNVTGCMAGYVFCRITVLICRCIRQGIPGSMGDNQPND